MRFKAALHPSATFAQFTASLASLGSIAWVCLNNDAVRFTIIPEHGTQVWAVLSIDSIFETYAIQSQEALNAINLEVPLAPLLRALRSVSTSTSASLRLTKKDGIPTLCITLLIRAHHPLPSGPAPRESETRITQDIPVRVLSAEHVSSLHEPRSREPDVHILLPPLAQLKSISDRFSRLANARSGSSNPGYKSARLALSANMHGSLRLALDTDALAINSTWTGLSNPELDPANVDGGVDGVEAHPSSRMRERGANAWAGVRVDARDWGRVLSVGRLGGRVVACFCDDHALILYVYLPSEDGGEESVLTYYITSYAA